MTELPPSWRIGSLADFADTQLGKMLNTSKQTGLYAIPYLRNINLRWGSFDLSDVKSMDIGADELEKFIVKKGDLLICEGGEPGRSAVWNSEETYAFQNAIHRIRPRKELDSHFLMYYFEHAVKNGILDEFFTGVTIKHFSQEKLRKLVIPVPPLEEQKRIVEILEEQLRRLDAGIASADNLIRKSGSLQTSFLNAVINGCYSQDSANWDKVLFKDLGTWFGGGTPSKSNSEFWKNGSIPWLTPKDMKHEVIVATEDKITESAVIGSSTKLINGPSLAIVVRSGILAHSLPIAVVPIACTLNQDMKALVPREDVSLSWVAWSLRAREQQLLGDCRKAGTTVASLEMSRFYQETLRVPPISEQLRLVDLIEFQIAGVQTISSTAQTLGKRSQSLRRSLFGAAFTGQLKKEQINV